MKFVPVKDRSKDAPLAPCTNPSDGISSIVIPEVDEPSPRFFASTSSKGEVSVYKIGVEDNSYHFAWSETNALGTAVNDLALTSDSVRIAAAGEDGTIRLLDMTTLHEIDSFGPKSAAVTCVAFAPQNNVLIAGLYSGDVNVYDARWPRKLVRSMNAAHNLPVTAVSSHPDGSVFLSTGLDGIAKVWDASGPLLAAIVGSENRGLASGTFSPNGRYALLSANVDGSLGLWDLAHSGRLRRVRRYLRASSNYWMNGSFMGDGTVLAGSEDGRILAYDVQTTNVIAEFNLASTFSVKIPMVCAGSKTFAACGGIGSPHPVLFELRKE